MKKEFKIGDKVTVGEIKSTGMIVDIKENRYIIELDEALPIRFFTIFSTTYHFDPRTFIVRVEVEDARKLNLMDDDGASAP